MARMLLDLSPLLHSKRLLAIMLLPVFLVTVVAMLAFRIATHSTEAFHSVSHTYNVIGSLDAELKSLLDIETSVRGYMLTRREEFLEPYQAALEDIPSRMKSIES